MPGWIGYVFRVTKHTYGTAGMPQYPGQRHELACVYAKYFSDNLKTILGKVPSFSISVFKGALLPREIAPETWSTSITVEFRAVKNNINKDEYYQIEHQLMTGILEAIDNSAIFKKWYENGDLKDVFFGIQPIWNNNADHIEGLSVHFVAEGKIFSENGGIPVSRFTE